MNKDEFVKQQAEAFLNYLNKRGSQSFEVWAESKDFFDVDKKAIMKFLDAQKIMIG